MKMLSAGKGFVSGQDLPPPPIIASPADQQEIGPKPLSSSEPQKDATYKEKLKKLKNRNTRLLEENKYFREQMKKTRNHNAFLNGLLNPGTLESGYTTLAKYKSYKKLKKEHKVCERRMEHLRFMLEESKSRNADLRKKTRTMMELYATLKEENEFLQDELRSADNEIAATVDSDEDSDGEGDWRHAQLPEGMELNGHDLATKGTRREREMAVGFDGSMLPPHTGKRPPKRNMLDDSADCTPSEDDTGEEENYEDSDDREYESDGGPNGEPGTWASGNYAL